MNLIQKIVTKVGMDKIAHFFVSAFLVLAFGRFLHPAIAIGITLVLGIVKELLDKTIDWKDLIADSLGAVLSLVILLIC